MRPRHINRIVGFVLLAAGVAIIFIERDTISSAIYIVGGAIILAFN